MPFLCWAETENLGSHEKIALLYEEYSFVEFVYFSEIMKTNGD